jgi:hypothetical protein
MAATDGNDPWKLSSNVPNVAHFREALVKRVEFGVLELCVVEAEKVVHDDVAS